ncbi:integrase family protein [Halanaeroarchaeum sulfurireducens]|uniref:Integrase family protein n=2 Tax=Halanaeroarchaeum sulfurireducens TaxID=1604004 RepID=A0A0F7PCH0_9EURY|nr:integrase family protein [Halanaeroarchaeum sulfurireducens]
MMTAPADEIQSLRSRIDTGEDIDDGDQEALLQFDDALTLLSTTYSDHRHLKLLRHLTIIAESVGGIAEALEDRDAAETIVRWINRSYDNEETNRDYRVALKVFGRRVSEENGDEPPDSLDWVPSGTSNNYDPAPDPTQMLDWDDDVLPMIEATKSTRDAAAIALQFDAGLRGWEFKDMTVGAITDHKHGLQATVDGKQGPRTVTLIPSVPHVQRWLTDHPAHRDPNAPLWSKLNAPEEMSYNMILNMFKRPAKRAGISKPVTPTNFRKSSASHLASRGMNQAHIEEHHGWVRGSDVAVRYVSVFADDADRELARIHGLDIEEDEPEPLAPRTCPRCGEQTPQDRDLCVWCGQALEPEAADKADRLDDLIVESLADATGDDARRLMEFREAARENPRLRAEAIDEIATLLDAH